MIAGGLTMPIKPVSHWHFWWRRWSTWLAFVNAMLQGYIFSQPILLIGLFGFAPDGWRIPIAVSAAVLAFVLPVVVVNLRQPALKEKCDAERPKPAAARRRQR